MTWQPVTDGHGGWRRSVDSPDTLVVVLHGLGRSGQNIRTRLAEPLSQGLPHAAFYAPDGFEAGQDDGRDGRQWFSRRDITPALRLERLRAAHPRLERLLDDELARTGLARDRLVLAGFSQGAIFSLHHVATTHATIAAVLAFAGRLATPVDGHNATPVSIVYGTDDGDHDGVEADAARLRAGGHPVQVHWLAGLGHDLSADGVRLGIEAIRRAGSRA